VFHSLDIINAWHNVSSRVFVKVSRSVIMVNKTINPVR